MNTFHEYITEKDIIFYLCRLRAKIAKQRDKKHKIHLLSSNVQYNYHLQVLRNDLPAYEQELIALLPKRKKWRKLGRSSRKHNGQTLNSIDKNIKSLRYTVDYFKKTNPQEPFLLNLNKFIKEVKESVEQNNYHISKPEIYPKKKDDSKGDVAICRPISLFSLKDKIIICLANKYLTNLFDKYLYPHSFAFRAARVVDGKMTSSPTHHDAIKMIIAYLDANKGKKLWVAECDMMKFYDSVNHSIIKRFFRRLINKAQKGNISLNLDSIKNIFYSYLSCYSFNRNVLPYNEDKSHFANDKINNGKYEWVKDELLDSKYYKSLANVKIGVPQGGALSCLIANIVLDYADRKVMKASDKDLLYIRYCDDMIVMHPRKMACKKTYMIYQRALKDLKLIPHNWEKDLKNTSDSFWKAKSKSPYKWDDTMKGGFPWLGFVGYEIHHNGHLRVRKRSLKKEMNKQLDIVSQAIKATEKGSKRVRNKTIEESVNNRLIGMSVGRVKLWNAATIKNEMCWVNGFSELSNNKYSRMQAKRLDAHKNMLVRKLKKLLKKDGEAQVEALGHSRQNIYYGKPFSYYYHLIEKNHSKDSTNDIESKNNNLNN
jgi:Reverse transcriptase (RNA-dependent DNA polymerase)